MYTNSDKPDCTGKSRKCSPEFSGHTSDGGIISQPNNTVSRKHDTRFDDLEIPECVRNTRHSENTPELRSRSNMHRATPAAHPSNGTNGRHPTSQTKQKTNTAQKSKVGTAQKVASQAVPKAVHRNTRRRRKSTLDVVANILIQSKKSAIVCALLLLCIGICIPLAVYGAASSNEAPEANTDILISNTNVADAFEPELVYRDSEKTLSANGTDETISSDDTAPSESDVSEFTDKSGEIATPDIENAAGEIFAADNKEPVAEPEPVLFNVTVSFYDRETLYCSTSETTLRQLLADNGIWLGENEHPSVGLDETLEYDSWISVDKTEYASVTESEYIPYETDIVNVTSIPRGTYQTVTAGQCGTRDTVYTVEYLNGVEVGRTEEYDYISAYPVNEVCYYGTGGTFTASDGNVYSYSYCKNVRATYYNIYGTTASGMATAPNVVATDPSVFPLGTQLYVMNDTFDLGVMTAADTGGAVHGDLIDIWMDESCPYYSLFASQGVWSMTVYVLD